MKILKSTKNRRMHSILAAAFVETNHVNNNKITMNEQLES